jgi:Protein of unknown function (DUF3788)
MEPMLLTDQNQFPTEEIIFSHIGKSKTLWISLFEYIHSNHPDISEEWRYYKDGKSWLFKTIRKKKTVFWLAVIKNAFRVTFYFTDKAEKLIADSPISMELKKQFKEGKRYNKIRGITVVFKNKKDVEYVKELIGIKLSLK